MVEQENYQMAVDLLSYHLGLSEEEAKERLGLSHDNLKQKNHFSTPETSTNSINNFNQN